ncbi:formin-like protein 9 isoform X1 [Typha angustifolia]|uniref:formin-like protein 9 isoform X1 n=1 Tax=Typha angustifolia TaxID=59011 RepID=UPI003C2F3DAD
MGSVSKCCFCLLMLLSFTFLLFNSQLLGTAWDLKDNVGGDMGHHILSKFRSLLGSKSPSLGRSKHHSYHYSPAPAPVEEVVTPAPIPLFHPRIYSRSPLLHRSHAAPPGQSREHERDDRAKVRRQRIAIAVAVLAGAISLIIISAVVVLVCKRFRRAQKRSLPLFGKRSKAQRLSSATNKVSFDPGPELFYLNSLAPYLESDFSLKQSSESKIALANESTSSSSSYTGEVMNCEQDTVSFSDEENLPTENLQSDDDESFHSICCSPSPNGSASAPNCSPSNSSYASISPICRSTQFVSVHSPFASKRRPSMHSTPVDLRKAHPTFPQSLVVERSQTPSTPNNQEMVSFDIQRSEHSFKSHSPLGKSHSSPTTSRVGGIPKPPPPPPFKPHSRLNDLGSSLPAMATSTSPSKVDLLSTPPKGTPGASSIPKPPPPPPLKPPIAQNGCNSRYPPPPPPCPTQQTTPVGKDGSPLPKLKPLHWDKVRAAPDRAMVWDKIRSSSFEFDEQMIESLFGYNLESSAKHEEAKSKTPSPNKHVLEQKRLQNIIILLKALNTTTDHICDALLQGNGLCVQQLEALVKMMPTKEEEEKLSNYAGDVEELDPAEKFVKVVLNIPFAFSRIEVMLYRETFEDEVAHLNKSFAMLEAACKELRSSRLFLRLLEAVLKTGNRMNVGTIRGGARAFKLDALLKLADVKGTDGKTTLLHFVVQEMIRLQSPNLGNKTKIAEEREDDCRAMGLDLVSGLSAELCNVKKTASIDLDVLISSVSNLSAGMSQLKHLIEKDLSTDDANQSFVHSMKSFNNHAERTIKELKDDEDRVLLHVRDITEYYHGGVSKDEANPLRIFVIVRDFLAMLDRVCKELRDSKINQAPNLVIPFR